MENAATAEGQKAMRLLHSGRISCEEIILRNRRAICSLVLGRDFGESFEAYMERRPDVRQRVVGYEEAITLLGGQVVPMGQERSA